jgi:hypothetical protein
MIEQLDKKAETTMLLPHEVDMKHCLKERLIQLLRERNKLNGTNDQNNIIFSTEMVTLNIFSWLPKASIGNMHFQLEEGSQIIRENMNLSLT